MGRILKRVPLDFHWPRHQVWKGYLNPFHSQKCEACNGSGRNRETKKLFDDWSTHSRTDGREGWGEHLEQEDVQALIEEIKRLHEEWEKFEPPTGEGFQLWETTSEGSPDSPVFETIEALCNWCSEHTTTLR